MADKAKNGDTVAVHYTGTLEDGTVFDSSREGDPLEFELGTDNIIEGFNDAVEGMEVGEERGVDVGPDDAYGQRRDEYVIEVSRDELPDDVEPQVGQALGVQLANGQQATARITDVGGDDVTLDLNHPLAGRKLHFDIELMGVK